MFGRCLVRLVALVGGLIIGLAAVVALAVYLGIWRPPALDSRPIEQSAPVPSVPTPTLVPGATQINSLADLSRRGSSLRGQLIRVVVTDEELTQEATNYLRSQGSIPVSNVRVRLYPGQMVLTGTARQGVLAFDVTVTAHPTIVDGALKMAVESVEPPLIARFSQIAAGQTIDLGLSFEARTVDVGRGQMVVTGTLR